MTEAALYMSLDRQCVFESARVLNNLADRIRLLAR